ncbi:MAG: hypothetical protein KJ950_02785 [Proteobacteria bacterium]|nr:hypothetical protein [Pseudomonadota bacterium]MBU1686801.1 hypothetical protein [Pseudomonadota bacterium]
MMVKLAEGIKDPMDSWAELGELSEENLLNVLTRLYTHYEKLQKQNPASEAALDFFRNLGSAIDQTNQCNSNRR